MKVLYKCRVCGKIQAVSSFELDCVDLATLKMGRCLSAKLDSLKPMYSEILTKCDSDHYGIMDFVGFGPEQEDERC